MTKSLEKWYIAETIFIIIIGAVLHFVYKWSGKSNVVGVFSPINESTWEHLKMLFWPGVFISILEYAFIGKRFNNYFTAKAVTFYVGIFLIVSLFYTFKGVVGKNFIVVDILIFIISVIVSQYLGYEIMTSNRAVSKTINSISLLAIGVLTIAFIVFTFNTPKIPLFKDPKTNGYVK